MSDIGRKRPTCDDVVKAKCGRPKKKPGYDKGSEIQSLLEKVVELMQEPYDDRKARSADAPTIESVAQALCTTELRTRKLLITAGYYSTKLSRRIQEMRDCGSCIEEIMKATGLGRASVHAYLPYMQGAYKLPEPTLMAEQSRLFRRRKKACELLCENLECVEAEEYFWKAIAAFEHYLFYTEVGIPFRYTIKDEKLLVNREEKIISKNTAIEAFHQARKIQCREGFVSGSEKLETFGASYLYAVFLRIGVCVKEPCKG